MLETGLGPVLGAGLMLAAAFGTAQSLAGLLAVLAFARRPENTQTDWPPVTVLKPVCGDEPGLEAALLSFCTQDYPDIQIIIGAQDRNDPALDVARRLQGHFPALIDIVVDPALHGPNRKISNLMNMLPAARHQTLVFGDSDLHVRPDYLRQVVSTLLTPGTGLVTAICGGEAVQRGIAGQLGAMHISHSFLPGALLGASVGRQDCLGTTMAIRRHTLEQAGGLAALVPHLADDNLLGRLVRQLGLAVRIAPTMPVVTVQESSLRAIWLHELRWARTIRTVAPVAHGLSVVQFPLVWALLAVVVSAGGRLEVGVFLTVWALRAAVADIIDLSLRRRRARRAVRSRAALLPLRDVLSVLEIAASFLGDAVIWRGHTLQANRRAQARVVVPAG